MTRIARLSLVLTGLWTVSACPSDDASGSGSGSDTDDGTTMSPTATATETTPTTTMTATDSTATDDPSSSSTDPSDSETESDTEPAATARIRVVHASPEAPAVDIYVEGVDDPVVTDLAYTQATPYLDVPEGDYNFLVRPAGADPADPPVYETGMLTLPTGAVVTAVAAGLVGSDDEADAFRVLPLVENFTDPGAGNAAVRLLHAGSDAPAVGIDIGNDDPTAPELDGVARFADSGDAGVPLPSGAQLQVGIAAGGATVTAFTTPEIPEGANLFVIATGLLGRLPREDAGFGLIAVGPDGTIGFLRQNPRIYALHGSWNAGEVDICAADAELFGDIAYRGFAGVQVPPGDYSLSVYAGSAQNCMGPRPVYTTPDDVTVDAGEQYLAVAAGAVGGDPAFRFVLAQEQFTLDADGAVVRVLHTAGTPGVSAVEVGLIDGDDAIPDEASVVIDAFAFGDESDEIALAEGTYPVGIGADIMGMANYPNPTVLQADLAAVAGARVYVTASGLLGAAQPENALTLNLIDTTVAPWECLTCN